MPIVYNPSVNDRSGEILGSGIAGAAQINAQGQMQSAENLSRGIASAGQSIGRGIEQAGSIYAQNKAKLSSGYGKIDGFLGAGYIAKEEADRLSQIKNPDKLHGELAVIEQQFQNDMIRKRQVDTMNMRLMEEEAGRKGSRVGTTTTMVDPITGQKVGAYFQNDRQVVPFKGNAPADQGLQGVRKVQVGPDEFIYTDQNGKPLSPNLINAKPPDPVAQAKLTKLQEEKAYLDGEAAKGRGDAKDGANWWPWSETIKTRQAGVAAQLKSMAGAPLYDTPQAVKAAVRAGKITPEEATGILRSQFGMQ